MTRLSKNLSRSEFQCKGQNCHHSGHGNCGFDTADIDLVKIVQATANHFATLYKRDVRVDVTGGNRCRSHNDALREQFKRSGGRLGANTAQESQHIYGRALDFKLAFRDENKQIPPREVYSYMNKEFGNEIALGLYVNRVHVDTRTLAGQRWDNT